MCLSHESPEEAASKAGWKKQILRTKDTEEIFFIYPECQNRKKSLFKTPPIKCKIIDVPTLTVKLLISNGGEISVISIAFVSGCSPILNAAVGVGFRGQVGEMSAIPHAIATKRMIRKGDVLVTGAGADVGDYSCELERIMIVGNPTPKQKRYFNAMVKAQEAAFKMFKPGVKCSDIDKATIKVFKKAGLMHLVKHHTGHGLGLEGHEPPWLDVGNEEPLRAGMVVSCEPGIYET
ncbi:MAG: M24 family metallopeptidase, partial [Candidatus Bathyarchaeia archaeon]|nr:M24 family metallopeptidase [Candidatus Bathyarchaeia archaeon]